ncbi:MAG: hypothetical protein AMS19_02515 [Gemmatimonas sp. SG8_23]|jgi:hypothetical protein|nr:MAG: hypothetical protein AMS19_02515 [Gemmatimonas sp. SG8_23]
MGSFCNYLEDALLDHAFMKTALSQPTNLYVGLSFADPGDDVSGLSEPSGGSYARVQTSGTDWNAASGGALDNANAITFPVATADWGTADLTHFVISDASSGGNYYAHGQLTAPRRIYNGDQAIFPAGDLDITLD